MAAENPISQHFQPTEHNLGEFLVPQSLTHTQANILWWRAKGLSPKEIGKHMHLSGLAVQGHINRSLKRLQASSVTESVLRAKRYGLLDELSLTDKDVEGATLLTTKEMNTVCALIEHDGRFSSNKAIAERLQAKRQSSIIFDLERARKKIVAQNRTRLAVVMTLYTEHIK